MADYHVEPEYVSPRRPALLMIRHFGAEDDLDLLRFPDS